MTAREIIDRFGGIRPLATRLGHQNHTTVQGWWERDLIPAQRQAEVLDAASKAEVELTAADLIASKPAAPADERAAAA